MIVEKIKYVLFPVIANRLGSVVTAGPFKGLKYIASSIIGSFPAKLFGTYEMELHSVIEEMLALPSSLLINIGAADGYYAIGYCLRRRESKCVAFEMLDDSRHMMESLAGHNGCKDRITIEGYCDVPGLASVLSSAPQRRTIVLMDVEGYEESLLDPIAIPNLSKLPILVEAHEFVNPKLASIIRERFVGTHAIREIWTQPRQIDQLSPVVRRKLWWMPGRMLIKLMAEYRPGKMQWLWMTPKTN